MKDLIKKAFQLKKNEDSDLLKRMNSRLKVSSLMLSAAREEIEKIMHIRDQMINVILLEDFNYIVKMDDKVIYMDQIDKIYVYNGKTNGFKVTTK